MILGPILRPPLGSILHRDGGGGFPLNLLRFSEGFDNATHWTPIEATLAADIVAGPDGRGVADRLLETTANNLHVVGQPYTPGIGTIVTFSCFVKGGLTRNLALLQLADTANFRAWINLSTGAVTNVTANCTAGAVDAGGGWWRAWLTRTISTAGARTFSVGAASAAGTAVYVGNAAYGLYLAGAQLVEGDVRAPYRMTV